MPSATWNVEIFYIPDVVVYNDSTAIFKEKPSTACRKAKSDAVIIIIIRPVWTSVLEIPNCVSFIKQYRATNPTA